MEAINQVGGFCAGARTRVWLVGGSVRDLLRGRAPVDIDLVTPDEPFGLARDFADSLGGSYFVLSEEFASCRVIAPAGTVFDFQKLRGGDIADDLRQRDFTVDAMAMTLPDITTIIDPLGGRADLEAGRLAPVSDDIFATDPLRLLRAVRLEKTLGLRMTAELEQMVRRGAARASEPAAERRFFELVRILETPGGAAAVRRLDDLQLLPELLPELTALKGIAQNDFHHLDVYEHVLAAAEAMGGLLADPASVFSASAPQLADRLEAPAGGDATRKQILSLAALLHDIGKPGCRFVDEDERVRFIDHDRLSAKLATQVLRRFNASNNTIRAVNQLVRQHMRLVVLVHDRDISERARLRYLKATEPFTPESLLVSVSDRLAVRGPGSSEAAIERHLEFAREMMDRYFSAAAAAPLPALVDGADLIAELGLAPGPLVGKLLEAIGEEQQLGQLSSRDEALALARDLAKKADA